MKQSIYTLKERREILKDYILNSISYEGYDLSKEEEPKTNKDLLLFVLTQFKSEKNQEIKRFGFNKAFEEHISGLPSYLNFDFENYKILELFNRLGYTQLTDREQDTFLLNYWNYMRTAFFQLCEKEGINLYEVFKE